MSICNYTKNANFRPGQFHQDLPDEQGVGHSLVGWKLLSVGYQTGEYWSLTSKCKAYQFILCFYTHHCGSFSETDEMLHVSNSLFRTNWKCLSLRLFHCVSLQEVEKGAKPAEAYNYALEILITKSELEEKNGLASFNCWWHGLARNMIDFLWMVETAIGWKELNWSFFFFKKTWHLIHKQVWWL